MMTNETPPATDEHGGRRRAETPNHYREALAALDRARTRATNAEDTTAVATLASAHATMLLANETRISNLIGYLSVLRIAANTPAGIAKIRQLEQRIDAALGTDEIGGTDA